MAILNVNDLKKTYTGSTFVLELKNAVTGLK